MARNILFSGDSPEKILNGTKTMTARFWAITPPKQGEIVTASTGRKKETRFAKLRILKVTKWKPDEWHTRMYIVKTGYSPQQIAKKEGFNNFPEFFNAYSILNQHHDPCDPNRTHWFIEFELIEKL